MTLRLASAAFLDGYRLATAGRATSRFDVPGALEELVGALLTLEDARLPFAVEGAAMGLEGGDRTASGLPDATGPRVGGFSALAPAHWGPFIALGRGCALARAGTEPPSDPMVLDGYGFHAALFGTDAVHPRRGMGTRYWRGMGRAFWFRSGGHAYASTALADRLDGPDEIWVGMATACTFAGDPMGHAGVLRSLGSARAPCLARGAEEALRLWRTFGDDVPPRVEEAVEVLAT